MDKKINVILPLTTWSRPKYGFGWFQREESPPSWMQDLGSTDLQPYEKMRLLPLDSSGNPVQEGMSVEQVCYQPFAFPDLYREFAELGETPEELLDFANRYGELGYEHYTRQNQSEWNGEDTDGERQAQWMREIRRMRLAVHISDAFNNLKSKKTSERNSANEYLRYCISWTKNNVRYSFEPVDDPNRIYHTRPITIAADLDGRTQPLWDSFGEAQYFGVVKAASAHLAQEINRQLIGGAVKASVSWRGESPSPGKLALVFGPTTLLSSLWFQFAARLCDVQTRVCEWCGEPLTGRVRADKRFCSDKCRTYEQRAKKRGFSTTDFEATVETSGQQE